MVSSAQDVARLREETGAGMLDCKKALDENNGDFDKAKEQLRERGFAAAAKRAERETAEGMITSYIHHNGRYGSLVEVNCESDFVARTADFQELVQQLAIHIAAANPLYLSQDEMPKDSEDDPKDVVLLLQPYVKDESRTIQDLVTDTISKTGENIRVRRFARFELGRS
jgi:elongation factor Ts